MTGIWKAPGATIWAKHGKFSMAPLTVQPRNGHSARDPRLHSVAVADTGASYSLLHRLLVESVGGSYNPSQTLQIDRTQDRSNARGRNSRIRQYPSDYLGR